MKNKQEQPIVTAEQTYLSVIEDECRINENMYGFTSDYIIYMGDNHKIKLMKREELEISKEIAEEYSIMKPAVEILNFMNEEFNNTILVETNLKDGDASFEFDIMVEIEEGTERVLLTLREEVELTQKEIDEIESME